MPDPADRLEEARIKARFTAASDAARRYGWNENTYRSHENGTRDLSRQAAFKYAKAFKVSSGWLLFGETEHGPIGIDEPEEVPLVGFVGAGALANIFAGSQGPFETVPAPDGSTEDTVAVEIRGDSLGSFFDQWLVFYDDVRAPITADMINKLCVVGLADGRILVKKVGRGQRRGYYNLLSQFEPPIYDAVVEWGARVKNMVPR